MDFWRIYAMSLALLGVLLVVLGNSGSRISQDDGPSGTGSFFRPSVERLEK